MKSVKVLIDTNLVRYIDDMRLTISREYGSTEPIINRTQASKILALQLYRDPIRVTRRKTNSKTELLEFEGEWKIC